MVGLNIDDNIGISSCRHLYTLCWQQLSTSMLIAYALFDSFHDFVIISLMHKLYMVSQTSLDGRLTKARFFIIGYD